MTFWRFKEEAKRLGQEDGLGSWSSRPLESREDNNGKQRTGTVLNSTPFSQRKAKNKQLQEVQDLTPTPSNQDTASCSEGKHDTNSDRLGDNVSTSTPEERAGSSSKSSFIPFSRKHLRKG